jgi:hypothetical protein
MTLSAKMCGYQKVTEETATAILAFLGKAGWLKEFFENGHAAFATGRKSKAVEDAKDRQIEQLHAKLHRKNSGYVQVILGICRPCCLH